MLLVLFLVTLFTLLIVRLLPGGPIRALVGPRATVAQIAYYNQLYGFDKPIYVQYGKWGWHLAQGNFGYPGKLNQSVPSLTSTTLPKRLICSSLGQGAQRISLTHF